MSDSEYNPVEEINVVFPRQEQLYQKEFVDYILCKPKLIPLKSVTLEKLERMQREAELKVRRKQETDKTNEDK